MSSIYIDFNKMSKEERAVFTFLLKSLQDVLYVENIVEYYTKFNQPLTEHSSQFQKAAHKLYEMIKNGASTNEINAYVVELKKVPLSYGEMRSFFG